MRQTLTKARDAVDGFWLGVANLLDARADVIVLRRERDKLRYALESSQAEARAAWAALGQRTELPRPDWEGTLGSLIAELTDQQGSAFNGLAPSHPVRVFVRQPW